MFTGELNDEKLAQLEACQATGALPKGTKVAKCNSEVGDVHQDGTEGEIFASMATDIESILQAQLDDRIGEKHKVPEFIYFVKYKHEGQDILAGTLSTKLRKI